MLIEFSRFEPVTEFTNGNYLHEWLSILILARYLSRWIAEADYDTWRQVIRNIVILSHLLKIYTCEYARGYSKVPCGNLHILYGPASIEQVKAKLGVR